MATRRGAPDNELVEEIDGVFDRGAAWVGSHPQHVLLAIGVLLAIAAGVGFVGERRSRSASRAEAATASVYDAYLRAMGAQPGDRDAPEPANPELGKRTRAEYAGKLLAVAQEHPGTAAATNTRLLAAKLLEENEDVAGADAARKLAAEDAPPGTPLSAIAWSRWAVALESKGDLKGAAQGFEKAAEVESPGQVLALGDAARCYALLGENAKALALFARAEKLGVEVLPLHIRQRLLELRAAQGSPVKADVPGPS